MLLHIKLTIILIYIYSLFKTMGHFANVALTYRSSWSTARSCNMAPVFITKVATSCTKSRMGVSTNKWLMNG